MRTTITDLTAMKKAGQRIAMLTAYDTGAAMLAERAGAPVLLVGDSLGMVVHGFDTTLPVTLDMMVAHSAAVVRGSYHAAVIVDMPFGSYQGNSSEALRSAIRIMKESGGHAVKLEGGAGEMGTGMIPGDNIVGKVKYQDGKVYINEAQYFGNVPLVAWEFYIGGYQPAQKWLKDRKDRKLEFEDILHYQKIIVALSETDRIMKEIDKIDFMK